MKQIPEPPVDPIERIAPVAMRAAALSLAAIMLWQAADSASMFPPGKMSAPFYFYYMFIILPIHEGGHFLFMFFGRVLHIFGGTFWQVMMPLLLFIVALRQHSWLAWVWLTLAGVHIIPASPYIYDAPYRTLQLLGPKDGHDWYNLFTIFDAMDLAEDLGNAVYWIGILVGLGGLVGGVIEAVKRYQQEPASWASVE
ncbi:MAG: hypothetical protein MUF82_00860 [Bacteroidetes bacterium]|jgi:hypothetical protein|nr:hypothetical protein [Bacteroidota bacterium]